MKKKMLKYSRKQNAFFTPNKPTILFYFVVVHTIYALYIFIFSYQKKCFIVKVLPLVTTRNYSHFRSTGVHPHFFFYCGRFS